MQVYFYKHQVNLAVFKSCDFEEDLIQKKALYDLSTVLDLEHFFLLLNNSVNTAESVQVEQKEELIPYP